MMDTSGSEALQWAAMPHRGGLHQDYRDDPSTWAPPSDDPGGSFLGLIDRLLSEPQERDVLWVTAEDLPAALQLLEDIRNGLSGSAREEANDDD